MKNVRKVGLIKTISLIPAGVIVIASICGGIYLYTSARKLKSIQLRSDFNEVSLDVGTQYFFSIITTPSAAKINDLNCVVNDPNSSFDIDDNGNLILITGNSESNISLYVECNDIRSNVLSYSVIDFDAKTQADAASKTEAETKYEEQQLKEAESTDDVDEVEQIAKKFVKAIGDNVNIRSSNSTDGDVLGKAKKGDTFEKVEDIDDWTHILFNGEEGFIKSEFLSEVSVEDCGKESDDTELSNDNGANDSSANPTELINASSTPQVISKTFSANLGSFQYNSMYNTYEKNEVFELKVGDTLNYSVSVTNDTGKTFGPLAGNSIATPMLTLHNESGWMMSGVTLTSAKETVSYTEPHEGTITLETHEEHPDLFSIIENATSQEDLDVLNHFHGSTYRLTIIVRWVK